MVIRGEEERKGVVKFVGETRFANGYVPLSTLNYIYIVSLILYITNR